jgi:hypothetical protein
MPIILSRPKKLGHIDTVHYEIDMLRYAFKQLAEQKLTERDAWVYLEAFLLHYRNLIEFLGKGNPSQTDLHVTNIWQLAKLAEPAKLNELHADGKVLWARYEPKDDQGGGRISQYLQHCTSKRIDAKDWEVATMMNEVEPLLRDLEKYLGATTGLLPPVSPVPNSTFFSASTTVCTSTAAAVPDSEAPFKKRLKDFE